MNLKLRLVKLIKKIQPRYGLKDTDIILATFPKSGTTWFRFIYANLISLIELDGRVVDYKMLNEELPSSFDAHIYPKIIYQNIPRLVATHQIYDEKKFGGNKTIYLYRNPLDTMVSYWEYRKGFKHFDNVYTFKSFIRGEQYGLQSWIQHYLKWQHKADMVITYEELKENDVDIMKKVLNYFSIKIKDNEIISTAVERSRFKEIKKMEEEKGLDKNANMTLKENFRFARKGLVGEWKTYFDKDDLMFANNLFRKYKVEKFIF